eukprot:s454_g1.t1
MIEYGSTYLFRGFASGSPRSCQHVSRRRSASAVEDAPNAAVAVVTSLACCVIPWAPLDVSLHQLTAASCDAMHAL